MKVIKKIPNHVLDQSLNKYENKQKKDGFEKSTCTKILKLETLKQIKKPSRSWQICWQKKAKERNTIYLVDSDLIFENPTTTTTKTIINKMLNVVEKKKNKKKLFLNWKTGFKQKLLISQNNSRKKNINKIRKKKIKIIFLYKVTVVAIKRTTTSTINTIIITRHNYTRTLPVDEIFEMKFCS